MPCSRAATALPFVSQNFVTKGWSRAYSYSGRHGQGFFAPASCNLPCFVSKDGTFHTRSWVAFFSLRRRSWQLLVRRRRSVSPRHFVRGGVAACLVAKRSLLCWLDENLGWCRGQKRTVKSDGMAHLSALRRHLPKVGINLRYPHSRYRVPYPQHCYYSQSGCTIGNHHAIGRSYINQPSPPDQPSYQRIEEGRTTGRRSPARGCRSSLCGTPKS